MLPTYALKRNTAQTKTGDVVYRIEVLVTDRGELPDAALFVSEILDREDPKQDRYVRVATPGDLRLITQSRAVAIRQRSARYRSMSMQKEYASVTDANTAASFIEERLNALVVEYQTMLGTFLTLDSDGDSIWKTLVFPSASVGVLRPKIEAYESLAAQLDALKETQLNKVSSCAELGDAYTAALSARTRAQANLTALQAAEGAAQAVLAELLQLNAQTATLRTLSSEISTLWTDDIRTSAGLEVSKRDAGDVYLLQPSGSLPTTLANTPLATYQANILSTKINAISADVALAAIWLSDTDAGVATALAAKEKCAGDLVTLQSQVDTLTRERDEALERVRALCPSYTP